MSESDKRFPRGTDFPDDYVRWIRQQVGSRKIFLVFATVILRDEHDRILLQQRTDFDFWGIPGGAQELGEDIITCARRELREESGLLAGPLALVGVYTDPRYDVRYPNGDEVQQFTICFTSKVAGGEMRPDRNEVRTQRFFAPEALPWGQLPLWYRAMLQDALVDGPPTFRQPETTAQTEGQIESVRPFIGSRAYVGVGALVAVTRSDGRVLLIKRREDGYWAFPGGFSDLGENVAYTAQRELREEVGLTVTLERIVGVYSSPAMAHTYANGDHVQNTGVLFQALASDEVSPVETEEVAAVAWVTPAELSAYPRPAGWTRFFRLAGEHLDDGYFLY